jgi:hypothetical protein
MEANYTWSTRFFSRKYELFRNNIKTGELNKQAFSRKSSGEMNGKRFSFEMKKLFKPVAEIIDLNNDSVIGNITIFPFKRSSVIKLGEKEYSWQFDNFWGTRWSISNQYGTLVKYHSRRLSGTIDAYTAEEVLILAGFFLRNFFNQRSSIAAAT